MSNTILSVTVVDRDTNEVVEIDGRDCGFTYRHSRFKQQDAGRMLGVPGCEIANANTALR